MSGVAKTTKGREGQGPGKMRLQILDSRKKTYPGQQQPQQRFFAIRVKVPTVYVYSNSEIGNAVPERVFNGLEIRWIIPIHWTRRDIKDFYKSHKSDFILIHKFYDVKYVNGNEIGILTEHAKRLVMVIEGDLYNAD